MFAEVLLLEHLIQFTKLHVLAHWVMLDQELLTRSGPSRRYKSGWSRAWIVKGTYPFSYNSGDPVVTTGCNFQLGDWNFWKSD
jgi:hypothetical protein